MSSAYPLSWMPSFSASRRRASTIVSKFRIEVLSPSLGNWDLVPFHLWEAYGSGDTTGYSSEFYLFSFWHHVNRIRISFPSGASIRRFIQNRASWKKSVRKCIFLLSAGLIMAVNNNRGKYWLMVGKCRPCVLVWTSQSSAVEWRSDLLFSMRI